MKVRRLRKRDPRARRRAPVVSLTEQEIQADLLYPARAERFDAWQR